MKPTAYSRLPRLLMALNPVVLVGALALPQAHAQTIERVRLSDNDLSCQQIYLETQQMDSAIALAGTGPAVVPPQPLPAQRPATPQNAAPLSALQQAVLSHPNNANLTAEQRATLLAQTAYAEQRGNTAVASVQSYNNPYQGAVMTDPQLQQAVARARASGMSEAQINATLGLGLQRSGLGALAAPAAPAPAAQPLSQAGALAGLFGGAQGGAGAAGLAGMFGALSGMANAAAPAAAVAPVPVAAAPQPGYQAAAPSSGLGAQARARKEHLTTLFLSRGCRLAEVTR